LLLFFAGFTTAFTLIGFANAISIINNKLAVMTEVPSNEITTHKSSYDYYCQSGLCATGKQHIGCINKGEFGPTCPSNARVIELNDHQKRLLLHMHNYYRSTIAEGKTPNYEPALRMGALSWDDELAHLAVLNTMSCEIEVVTTFNLLIDLLRT